MAKRGRPKSTVPKVVYHPIETLISDILEIQETTQKNEFPRFREDELRLIANKPSALRQIRNDLYSMKPSNIVENNGYNTYQSILDTQARYLKQANKFRRARQKELKALSPKLYDQSEDSYVIGKRDIELGPDTRKVGSLSQFSLLNRYKSVLKRSTGAAYYEMKEEKYKENLLIAIDEHFAGSRKVIAKSMIKSMPASQVYRMGIEYYGQLDFKSVYIPNDSDGRSNHMQSLFIDRVRRYKSEHTEEK